MSPFARTWALWAEWGTRVLSFVSVCGEGVAEARRRTQGTVLVGRGAAEARGGGSVPLPVAHGCWPGSA